MIQRQCALALLVLHLCSQKMSARLSRLPREHEVGTSKGGIQISKSELLIPKVDNQFKLVGTFLKEGLVRSYRLVVLAELR